MVCRTDSLNDWTDTLKTNIPDKRDFVKFSISILSMDLPGVEPGRLGVSIQSSEPARPMLISSIPKSTCVNQLKW